MQINFNDSHKSAFRRSDGQYRLFTTIYRDAEKTKIGLIDFIYDSGAQIEFVFHLFPPSSIIILLL